MLSKLSQRPVEPQRVEAPKHLATIVIAKGGAGRRANDELSTGRGQRLRASAEQRLGAAPFTRAVGDPEAAGSFRLTGLGNLSRTASAAHAEAGQGRFSPFTDKLFRAGLGRLPTPSERREVEGLCARLAARGKHIFEIGAYLSHLMTQRADFRDLHPHARTFERVYEAELGRAPNLGEYKKLTAAVREARANGPVNPGKLVTFLVRSTHEYKRRVAAGAAYVRALQNAQRVSAGGGWGGSQGVADRAKAIAAQMGIPITSEKRDLATTLRVGSSTGSDHYTGNTNAYAVDFGVSGSRGDQLAQSLARAYGIPLSNLGTFNRHTITVDGQRFSVQLLWRVEGHFDHVHIGIHRA